MLFKGNCPISDLIPQNILMFEICTQQVEELQAKYNDQVRQCCALSNKLDATQKDLDSTSKSLANTEDSLKLCQYSLKERDFIISEQKKAGI